MKRVCVFCGSKSGIRSDYATAAARLGDLLVQHELELVYGGGSIGLMGVIADAVLSAGGRVIGVIPECLASAELIHPHASEMHIVSSMHVRKAMMAELSDAFIAMPGGLGTMEELFEVITWAQLQIHRKPIGLLNTAGFYNSWLANFNAMVAEGFVSETQRQLFLMHNEPEALLNEILTRPAIPCSGRFTLEET